MPAIPAAEPNRESNPEDVKLATHFRAYLDDHLRRHPSEATRAGDHQYDDRLEDLSQATRATDQQTILHTLETLPRTIDRKKLSRAGQIDLEIWQHALRYQLWLNDQTDPFATNPRLYNEYLSDSVYLVLTQSTLPKDRNIANAAKRITFIPKIVAAARANLQNPPRIVTEVAIKQNRGTIAFYEKEIFALTGETPAVSPLTAPCRTAVTALQEYQKFLENELLPRSTGNWRLGREKFAAKLEQELNAGLTAEEVIAAAEQEAERVEREMAIIARQQWGQLFPQKPLPPDDETGRRACIRAVLDKLGEDHGQPAELVADARQTVARIQEFIRERNILTLPNPDRCQIIEMPEFQRGFSVAYLNSAPPLDPRANSVYAVAPPPSDWPASRQEAFFREYNRAMLQILTIHEAYPGHYVQLEYANRHPSLIRKVLYSGVYAEGWAVYTEQMMLDQGYGQGNLSLRLHQLKFYLRAVLNAILDYRMHCTAMTDAEALELLVGRGFQTEGEAVGKVQRAKLSSAQLSTYFVGRTAFYRLRQTVQRAQGSAFDLARYHERVLNQGTIPVKYLPELLQ
ncbi:MAG: DUF885 domain-containing protein [Bacteroidales bacterium]|nr:DUF885 domain-containing protein [Bacteroidales bacterium]